MPACATFSTQSTVWYSLVINRTSTHTHPLGGLGGELLEYVGLH